MKDEWVRAAMTDDMVVADLLLRLKDSDSPPPTQSSSAASLPPWGTRQPRSKCGQLYKKTAAARGSPTTVLSWSGGGSGGNGGASPSEGCEESCSQPSVADGFRSTKNTTTNETTTLNTTGSKRSRRKKTFAELKEEESTLLKERTSLKKELAMLRLTLKEQRSTNENLKRMKLDLHVESGIKSEPSSCEPKGATVDQKASSTHQDTPSNAPTHIEQDHTGPDVSNCGAIFVLPDLNMMPDEECYPDATTEIS